MKVEFSQGGPADGRVQEIEGTPETLLIYELAPGKIQDMKPDTGVPIITHVYRSASKLTRDGAHVFTYRGRTR
jgi:hypothetical protein